MTIYFNLKQMGTFLYNVDVWCNLVPNHLHCFGPFVLLFLKVDFSGGFDFPEGDTLITHRVTPLTSQSVAYSLLMTHFWIAQIAWIPRGIATKKVLVPGTSI